MAPILGFNARSGLGPADRDGNRRGRAEPDAGSRTPGFHPSPAGHRIAAWGLSSAPTPFGPNLARDGLDQPAPQHSQDDVSLAGGTPSLDRFAHRCFDDGGGAVFDSKSAFHRAPIWVIRCPILSQIKGCLRGMVRRRARVVARVSQPRGLNRQYEADDDRTRTMDLCGFTHLNHCLLRFDSRAA
jgi:hypothetical protein